MTDSVARQAAQAGKALTAMAGASEAARKGLNEIGAGLFGAGALFAGLWKAIDSTQKRLAALGDSMRDMTENSKAFATMIGDTTWSEKLAAATQKLDLWTRRYEELGGATYSHQWQHQDAWEWSKRVWGAVANWWTGQEVKSGTNAIFDQVVANMSAAQSALDRLKEWSGEAPGVQARMGFADLGRTIQKSLIDPRQRITLAEAQLKVLLSIERKIGNPLVGR